MPVSYGWSDVGSWHAVWELSERDAAGNAAQGPRFSSIRAVPMSLSEKQLVALLGVDNVVVVTTDDAVLVARRDDGDGLRKVVSKLKDVAPALDRRPSESAPPLGLLPVARPGRSLSGQAHRGEAGRAAVAAAASSSRRALGRGARHGAGDDRRQRANAARERVRSMCRSAPGIGWKIPARSISN